MHHSRIITITILALVTVSMAFAAGGPPYSIDWYSIDGGVEISVSGDLQLVSVIGQTDSTLDAPAARPGQPRCDGTCANPLGVVSTCLWWRNPCDHEWMTWMPRGSTNTQMVLLTIIRLETVTRTTSHEPVAQGVSHGPRRA